MNSPAQSSPFPPTPHGSPAGPVPPGGVEQLIAALQDYVDVRQHDVARGAETPALASLLVEKYGYGLMKAADVLGVAESERLTAEVGRLVAEIDPRFRDHRHSRWASRPAGLSITSHGATQRII